MDEILHRNLVTYKEEFDKYIENPEIEVLDFLEFGNRV
jgi:hypothetical protein